MADAHARHDRRLRRAAACSGLQLVSGVLVLLAGPVAGPAAVGFVVATLLSFGAWGAFQAELALNPELDDRDRARWRMALACVPGAMALYWRRHVRRPAA
jgi:hypothetical protein